ncbi:MAG: hypothetical protein PHF86_10570 [Candidatus Nanoarchaeia archaeon]|nr:hypothetical protein [Candidatus Nanoarchaeia archaeon]
MTEKEAFDFFEEVKGKEIKRSDWRSDESFVPREIYNLSTVPHMVGTYYRHGIAWNEDGVFFVSLGFNSSDFGYCWKFVDNQVNQRLNNTATPVKTCTCTCTSETLLNFGCQCEYGKEEIKQEKERNRESHEKR